MIYSNLSNISAKTNENEENLGRNYKEYLIIEGKILWKMEMSNVCKCEKRINY